MLGYFFGHAGGFCQLGSVVSLRRRRGAAHRRVQPCHISLHPNAQPVKTAAWRTMDQRAAVGTLHPQAPIAADRGHQPAQRLPRDGRRIFWCQHDGADAVLTDLTATPIAKRRFRAFHRRKSEIAQMRAHDSVLAAPGIQVAGIDSAGHTQIAAFHVHMAGVKGHPAAGIIHAHPAVAVRRGAVDPSIVDIIAVGADPAFAVDAVQNAGQVAGAAVEHIPGNAPVIDVDMVPVRPAGAQRPGVQVIDGIACLAANSAGGDVVAVDGGFPGAGQVGEGDKAGKCKSARRHAAA